MTFAEKKLIKITVSDHERDAIFAAASEIVKGLKGVTLDPCLLDAKQKAVDMLETHLPYGKVAALRDFARHPDALAVIVDNLPTLNAQSLPATPYASVDLAVEAAMRPFDLITVGLIKLAGCDPFANPAENEGMVTRNVLVAAGSESKQSSHGAVNFGWHMDNPNGSLSLTSALCGRVPHLLAIHCLRNTEQVATSLVTLDDVLDGISYRSVRALQHEAFCVGPPESNERSIFAPTLNPCSLLSKDAQRNWVLRYDPTSVSVSNLDPLYASALRELKSRLTTMKASYSAVLQPGQTLLFRNTSLLHMRAAFKPLQDRGLSRWMRRIYGA